MVGSALKNCLVMMTFSVTDAVLKRNVDACPFHSVCAPAFLLWYWLVKVKLVTSAECKAYDDIGRG